MRYFITVLLFTIIGAAAMAQDTTKKITQINGDPVVEAPKYEPQRFAQVMPQFPGGDDSLMAYLQQHIHYPQAAQEKNIQGTVVLQFVVSSDGSISNIKALKEVAGGCTEESIRVVQSMPRWKPGINKGEPVPVYFNLPIVYQLTK